MILLSFNILNFDSQKIENQTPQTVKNTEAILRILEINSIKATFFVEVGLVEELKLLLKKIIAKGHEVALYSNKKSADAVRNAKHLAEAITEKNIRGIRRKDPFLSVDELKQMEFNYISDIENANILFPFKRLQRSTEIVEIKGVSIIPESISPYSQIPYNDLVFQTLPTKIYCNMVTETLKSEEFVMVYLNAWQFTDWKDIGKEIPFYRRLNTGRKLEDKLNAFLEWINERELATARIRDYIF